MGSKKKFGWGVGVWGELYPDFLNFFNFAKAPNSVTVTPHSSFCSCRKMGGKITTEHHKEITNPK